MSKSLHYKRNGEICALGLALIAIMSISCLVPLVSAASPNGISQTETQGSLKQPSLAASDDSYLSQPTLTLSMNSTGPYPIVNGHTMYPPLARETLPPPSVKGISPWYIGGSYSGSHSHASSIRVDITVPSSKPLSDEYYYVILSAWDSAGSYDQIGLCAYYGIWCFVISWTSGPTSSLTYHTSVFFPFYQTLGNTFTFYIATADGYTTYSVYHGSTFVVRTPPLPTGGNYLDLDKYYGGYYDYTDYLEVWQTHTSGGYPAFDFYFQNNYQVSGGVSSPTSFAAFKVDGQYPVPSNMVAVCVSNLVLVSPNSGGGGGGCPYLYVYDGSQYVNEGLLDIHTGYNGTDLVRSHVLTDTPAVVDGTYLIHTTEHWETISHINQVKLYETLTDGRTIQLPLIYAFEPQVGNVLPQLLFDDNLRAVELGAKWNNWTSQSIYLRFLALPWIHVAYFTFVIIGYNRIVKV